MKTKFQVRNQVIDQAIAADGVQSFEINAEALSVLLLRLRPLNNTGTLADFAQYLDVARALNNVTLDLNGHSILSMRGEDIAALNWLRWGFVPRECNPDNDDNDRRAVILPLILGKRPMDRASCLPAVQRGQLTLRCDFDIADTGYDGLRFAVDSIELPGASPSEYERRVQISQTPGATGVANVELTPGNLCRGLLLFDTTGFTGATGAPGFSNVRVRGDNDEVAYSGIEWETLYSLSSLLGRGQPFMGQHTHDVNAAGAGIEETLATANSDIDFTQWAYLPFDWTDDDEFSVDASGFRRFNLEVDVDTAAALRVVQMERIKA